MIDKEYCMSHYLAFRFVQNEEKNFYPHLQHTIYHKPADFDRIESVDDIEMVIQNRIAEFYIPGVTGIFLSGGIDSAILASYLPQGTPAYTFQCIAEGAIDETQRAKGYCDIYGLRHEIVKMYWNDFETLTPRLFVNQGPFHSIEVQILKAAEYAKEQGITRIIIGNASDCVFGGLDKLLSKDWTFDEFIERYTAVDPRRVLRNPVDICHVYEKYRYNNDRIDFIRFMEEVMHIESYSSYMHAFACAGVSYLDPYSYMKLQRPFDLVRIRNGEPKYMIRELFKRRYPDLSIPEKIPMPRAMDQWLREWKGPRRQEFRDNCIANLTGDQKWLCWCLERFLDIYEEDTVQ